MDRVNGLYTIDIGGGRRGFRDRNLAAGIHGTQIPAAHLNAEQEEILAVIEAAGLIPNAADWTQLLQALRLLFNPGRLVGVQAFTTPGTTVYTPTEGAASAVVEAVGGGGAGGGSVPTGAGQVCALHGGSAGSYMRAMFPAGIPAGTALTVGAGGAGVAGGAGGNGGVTSVGALLTVPGGAGGPSSPAGAPAGPRAGLADTAAGSLSGAAVLSLRGQGGRGPTSNLASQAIGGDGGASFFGPGGNAGGEGSSAGAAAVRPGAGGGGAGAAENTAASYAGGAGASGLILIWEFG